MIRIILLVLILISVIAAKVDIIAISPSTWIVRGENQEYNTAYYFYKVSVEGYFSIDRFKAYVALPLAYTYNASTIDEQYGLGDVTWYVGWQFGMIQPRIGMIIPGVYSTDEAWIGSEDLRLGLGLAVQPHLGKSAGALFSFETGWYPYISSSFGLAEPGSWDLTSITKGSYYFTGGMRVNLELLFNLNSVEWEWTKPDREFKITMVPVVSGSYLFTEVFEVGGKFGYGPTFAKIGNETVEYSSNNLSAGLYFNFNL